MGGNKPAFRVQIDRRNVLKWVKTRGYTLESLVKNPIVNRTEATLKQHIYSGSLPEGIYHSINEVLRTDIKNDYEDYKTDVFYTRQSVNEKSYPKLKYVYHYYFDIYNIFHLKALKVGKDLIVVRPPNGTSIYLKDRDDLLACELMEKYTLETLSRLNKQINTATKRNRIIRDAKMKGVQNEN